ncbi:MAG: aldehyde ferredoxin oxidoreductase family protein [Dehalococcoidia bacterium]|nr:aldehyde ferredoxin oxidoreductase family protein [Dehalococcoidia bacterium]
MPGGCVGKILFVDLSRGQITVEAPDEKLYYDYLGGYGIGARIIYSREQPGVDPLGPDAYLGFAAGVLTGTAAMFGNRYTVMGKSPLTGGWGDANSGGEFGPYLKFAGFDAVFFTGTATRPVYLAVEDGKATLQDASQLWGKDCTETEDILKEQYGKKAQIACIGPAGEMRSLISCIMNNKGRAAGRSGLGAVMGAKKLKAVVVTGNAQVPVASKENVTAQYRRQLAQLKGPLVDRSRKYGTCGGLAASVSRSNAPTKNWGGSGRIDFPDARLISDDNVIKFEARKYACWRCPLACGGHMIAGEEYDYPEGAHKPEYETLAAFGSNCLNYNVQSIIMANDICNRYGLDTISVGSTIAFCIECCENGVITKEETDGLEMTWGNHRAIVAMTEKLAKREGLGEMLADGVAVAARKIGRGTERFAVHAGGQEPGMHDPRLRPSLATAYLMDPTPGRHTAGSAPEGDMHGPAALNLPKLDPYVYSGKGESHRKMSAIRHVVNCIGICSFGFVRTEFENVPEAINAVMGTAYTIDDLVTIGERIANLRQAYTVRESGSTRKRTIHGRLTGHPAMTYGPSQGITIDLETQINDMLDAQGWDRESTKPGKEKLMALGLDDVAEDLWST